MAETVKIVYTGDTKELEDASQRAIKAIEGVTKAASSFGGGSGKMSVNLSKVSKSTRKAASSIDLLKAKIETANTSFAHAPLAQAPTNFRNIDKFSTNAAHGMDVYTAAQANANTVLLSFSQGIQDLPFGFIAIQNNITSLVAQFGHLQTKTGSLKQTFKLLLGSFTGPGGLLFLVSAATSALTIFSLKNRGAKKEVNEFKNYIDDLNKSLKTMGDAIASGLSGVTSNLTTLKLLYEATQNLTNSLDTRKKAAEEIIKLYPSEFNGLRTSQILAGEASKAYERLTKNLLSIAKAQGIFDTIVSNSKKQAEIIGKVYDLTSKQKDLQQDLNKAQLDYNKALSLGAKTSNLHIQMPALGNLNKAKKALQDNKDSISKLLKEYEKFGKTNINLTKAIDIDDFIKTIKDTGDKAGKALKDGFDPQKRIQEMYEAMKQVKINQPFTFISDTDVQKKQFEIVRDAIIDLNKNGFEKLTEKGSILFNLLTGLNLQSLIGQFDGLNHSINETAQKFADIIATLRSSNQTTQFKVDFLGLDNIDRLKEKIANLKSAILDAQKIGIQPRTLENPEGSQSLANMIQDYNAFSGYLDDLTEKTANWNKAANIVENTFSQIFNNIAQGKNVFDQILQSVERLVIKLAAAAAAAAAISVITGGAAAGGLGFLSLFGKLLGIPKLASGGFVQGPQLAVVGDAPGGEWVLNQQQMSALLNSGTQKEVRFVGEFVQRGNDLVAVVDTTKEMNKIF